MKSKSYDTVFFLAEGERMATLQVLWHLRENERRMLFAERGHKDLKTYCVKELKMSEGSAWRRISAMRLLKELPETELKIQTGQLNLTQLCQAQILFRQMPSSAEEKRETLRSIENLSTAATERILCERGPGVVRDSKPPRERAVRGGNVEVTLVLDQALLREMAEIEILLGKKFSKLELLRLMSKMTLENVRKKQTPRATTQRRRSAASRTVSRMTVREVKARDEHRCQYQDPETRQRCEARHGLQIEHKIPLAKGGKHTIDNLELLCANHNRLRAVQQFGVKKMKNFLPALVDPKYQS